MGAIVALLFSITWADISTPVYLAAGRATPYLHVMQNQSIGFTDISNKITINIGDQIIVNIVRSPAGYNLVKGAEWLDSTIITWNNTHVSFDYQVKWINPFIQGAAVLITINADTFVTTNTLTYNEAFVLNTLTINANSLYIFPSNSGPWIKGGIGPAEGVVCLGNIAYANDTNIFPVKDVSVRLYFDDVSDGSLASVGTNGDFILNNFVVPQSSSGVSPSVALKVQLVVAQGNASLITTPISNTINLQIDNQAPALGTTALMLLPDTSYLVQGRLQPEIGWYGQLTVSVKVNLNNATDNAGAGLSDNALFLSVAEQITANSGSTVNIQTREGVREIQAYIYDRVHNASIVTVSVSVDVTVPGLFSMTLGQDTDALMGQNLPESGWFNDETVSSSWTTPADFSLRAQPYQVWSESSPNWSAESGGVISANIFQSTASVSQLYVMEGGSLARTIKVRAVDRAGNIREASTTVFVDKTPPTINTVTLKPDLTLEPDSLELPEKNWYNNGTEVNWTWSAEDNGALPQNPYAYRYLIGAQNIVTVGFTNLSDIVIPSDEATSGNTFRLLVKDKAGNIATTENIVYVSEFPPSFNYCDVTFQPDSSDNGGDGVLPELLWYDQTTLNFVTTVNVDFQAAPLSKVYFRRSIDSTKNIQSINNPTVSNYEILPNRLTDITFEFVDKAGRGRQIFKSVDSAIISPINLNAALVNDKDSGQDGIDPEPGYYDSPTISMTWQKPTSWGRLRDQAYSLNINNQGWDSWFGTEGTQIALTANASYNVQIRAADMAGNVITNQLFVTVDTLSPTGSFEFIITNDVPHNGGVTPDSGPPPWYSDNWVHCSFLTINVTDTFALREEPYFVRNLDQAGYGLGSQSSQNLLNFSSERGSQQQRLFGAIADHAGNIISQYKPVYVDMNKPSTFYAAILDDSTDNRGDGVFPEQGWYDQESVNLVWGQSNDDGQLPEKPYRLRADSTSTGWTTFQTELFYNSLPVLEGGSISRNVYVQVRDKAGNLTTENLMINIDITPPDIITFNTIDQPKIAGDPLNLGSETLPLSGWFNTENIQLIWELPSENGQLKDRPYRFKADRGQTTYSDWVTNNIIAADVFVSANDHVPILVYLNAVDRAGNIAVVTRSIYVDTKPPIMNLQYDAARVFTQPYVVSSDTLWITLNSGEDLSITPTLLILDGSRTSLVSLSLSRDSERSWVTSLNLSSYIDGSYPFLVTAFDNASNKTGTFNNSAFFVVRNSPPPAATGFYARDMMSLSPIYTNLPTVIVTFNVDSAVQKFFLTETVFGSSSLDGGSFAGYPTGSYQYSFYENPLPDGQKNLYLWVAKGNGIVSDEAATASIMLDTTKPLLKVKPDRDNQNTDQYNNVSVPPMILFAQLVIQNQSILREGYKEEAIVTPSWMVLLPAGGGALVTYNLSPYMPDNGNRGLWEATYNSVLAPASGNAFFKIHVTDNALNVTNIIQEGGTFNINLDAAGNPGLEITALDGRNNGYTRFLTVNVVVSKDSPSSTYHYYRITDGALRRPDYTEVMTPWPNGVEQTVVSFRIDAALAPQDTVEGAKTLYAWSRRNTYINPGIISRRITYDATVPSISIVVAPYQFPTNLVVNELVHATMSVSEMLEKSPAPIVNLMDASRVSLNVQSSWEYEGCQSGLYIYSTTINVPGDKKNTNLMMYTVLSDLAGNEKKHWQAVHQVLAIRQYKDEVLTSDPYAEQGKPDFLMMSCVLSANDLAIHLRGIRLIITGSYQLIDVKSLKVFMDGDNDGNFNYNSGYGFDVLKGINNTNLDQTGIISIPFLTEELIPSSSSRRFFVVLEVGVGANQGDTFTMKFASRNAFDVANNEVVGYDTWMDTFRTKTVTIVKTVSGVYLAPQSGSSNITQNVNNGGLKQPLDRFTLYTDKGVAIWSGLKVKQTGSLVPQHINLSLYKDANYDSYFQADIDNLISYSANPFEAGKTEVTINLKDNQLINAVDSSKMTYFLVADFSPDSPIGATFNISIVSANDVLIDKPNNVVASLLPHTTQEFVVQPYISRIDIQVANNRQQDVFQGDGLVLQKMLLSLDRASPASLLRYVDYYLDGNANRNNDFYNSGLDQGVALYLLSANRTISQDIFDIEGATKVDATNSWSDGDKRLKIMLTQPMMLLTQNLFALVATIDINSTKGRQFGFTTHLEVVSQNPYFGFSQGTAKVATTVSTSLIEIIDAYSPSQPNISMNTFSRYSQKLPLSFDSYTKYGSSQPSSHNNDIVKYISAIGTAPGLGNMSAQSKVLSNPRPFIYFDEMVVLSGLTLQDNQQYYLSFYTVANRIDNPGVDIFSKQSLVPFRTDFSPPHLPNYAIDVQVGDDGAGRLNHLLNWEDFSDPESGLGGFSIEEKSDYTATWNHVAAISIADPVASQINERRLLLLNRKANMSYTYRIMAENRAGLLSDYIYSTPVTTVTTNKVLSNVSNYPNPFKSRSEKTTIFYYLNQDTGIEIRIYDSVGHFVRKYNYTSGISGKSVKGDCALEWDGRNEVGEYVEKGGYFVVIEAPGATGVDRKIVRMVGVIH